MPRIDFVYLFSKKKGDIIILGIFKCLTVNLQGGEQASSITIAESGKDRRAADFCF
jgi:hypothetical protein